MLGSGTYVESSSRSTWYRLLPVDISENESMMTLSLAMFKPRDISSVYTKQMHWFPKRPRILCGKTVLVAPSRLVGLFFSFGQQTHLSQVIISKLFQHSSLLLYNQKWPLQSKSPLCLWRLQKIEILMKHQIQEDIQDAGRWSGRFPVVGQCARFPQSPRSYYSRGGRQGR